MLGIVCYHYLGSGMEFGWHWPLLVFLLFFLFARRMSQRYNQWLTVLAMIMLFMFGMLRLQSYRLDNSADHLLSFQGIEAYEGVIIDEPVMKRRSVNVRLDVKRVFVEGTWQKASGRVNGYVSQEHATAMRYGDRLLIKGSPEKTQAPSNPGEFDFANYLGYNNIFHQQFIGSDFAMLGREMPNWFVEKSIKWRSQCRDLLMAHISDDEVRSVMLAIVLGIKDELDPELQSAFSASGAMHVLAVSGLHVGIIYMIVLGAFKLIRLDGFRYRWWVAVASLLVLWMYAFVTGLSPSVLRAVTMFSFVALAKAMNRNSNIYNTLAASAFVLLWFNPYLLMSVGFQLSYLAVFGIVYLQPRFYRLLDFNHTLLDKIWAITCVSLAAQIATAPLSVLYFHQFPSYFLISNLFIIPSAFIMLLMGLAMLILSPLPYLGEGLGWLIEQFVYIVNSLVFWVRDLPGSTLNGIRITTAETWMIYAVVFMLILLFHRKRMAYLKAAFAMACLFCFTQVNHMANYANSGALRILNVSNATAIDFRFSRQARLMADSAFMNDENRRRFHFEPGRLQAGVIQNPAKDELSLVQASFFGNDLVCFNGETFLILKKAVPFDRFRKTLRVNHLVLSENVIKNLDDIQGKLTFDQLLIDSSNKGYITEKLVNQAKALDLKVHAIRQDGYFEKLWQE